MKTYHKCPNCETKIPHRKYWKKIIDGDEGLAHVSKVHKAMLLEMILLCYQKPKQELLNSL